MVRFFKKNEEKKTLISACAQGEIVTLEEVNDPIFSQKMMGDGIAIQVKNDTIFSPIDGNISLIAETSHAFGITTDNGLEIMVHVGLETVKLNGMGFHRLAKVGDFVKKGTPILKVDRNIMKEHKIDLITPIIILNHQQFSITSIHTSSVVDIQDDILCVVKKV